MRIPTFILCGCGFVLGCGGATDTELLGAPASGSSKPTPTSTATIPTPTPPPVGTVPPVKPVKPGTTGCRPGSEKDCNSNEYCQVTSCDDGAGTCVARPDADAKEMAPVCGCDAITYFSAETAAIHGVSVAASGACAAGTKCTAGTCPGDAKCSIDRGAAECSVLEGTGTCWQLPKSCDDTASPRVRSCFSAVNPCTTVCAAIDRETQYRKASASACP